MLTTIVWAALVLPTFTLAKVKVPGFTPMTAAAAVPTPFRAADCGLCGALSATARVPVCVPAAVGLKVTLMEQFAPAASCAPQLLVCRKLPVIEIPEMLRAAVPVLERVMAIGALVEFTICEGKLSVLGDKAATDPTLVPLSETVPDPMVASLATLRVPVKLPIALGRNTTLMLVVPPTGMVRGSDDCEVTTKGALAVIPLTTRFACP